MLDYEAKRRPALAQLITDIDNLSVEAIQAAKVPLPWIRKALLDLKRHSTNRALAVSLEPWLVDGTMADPVGEMRRWEGGNSYVRIGRTQLEMCHGQLLWVGATGLWIDTVHTTIVDPQLVRHTVGCGSVTRSAYMLAVRTRARELCPDVAQPEPAERIRFYRPG
jgi:hypothetical protein